MLDVQGRAVLVKAVLSAMSIYIMMALDLPAWMLNALRRFVVDSCGAPSVRERATKNKKILAHSQDHMRGERQRIIPFNELAEDCR